MLTYHNFDNLASIQASVFTSTLFSDSSNILKKLFSIDTGLFDGAPTVLPLPPDAPPDIPRVTIKDKQNAFRLDIALHRVNIFRLKVSEEDNIIPVEFYDIAIPFLNSLLDALGTKCLRLATVFKRYYKIEHPASELANHFSKESFLKEPFDRPEGFEIHSLKKYKLPDSCNVNSWVRVKNGTIHTKDTTPKSAILIEQDINTFPEEMGNNDFTQEQVAHFFKITSEELDNIIKLYFPAN